MGVTRRWLIALAALAAVGGCGGATEPERPAAKREEPAQQAATRRPGELPADGAARVGGVDLPPGRRQRDERGHVVLWRADVEAGDALETWRRLADAFPRTGLWPVLIAAGDSQPDFRRGRNWRKLAAADPETVLRRMWTEGLPLGAGERRDYAKHVLKPFGRDFPGLAEGGGEETGDDAAAATIALMEEGAGSLALVPVGRPADVIAATGWQGAVNSTDDPAQLSAVLRSWEDRFDAVIVGMSLDTLHVAARRPATGDDASLVAAEQKAFCPDIVEQGTGTIGALAGQLEGSPAWYFWWD